MPGPIRTTVSDIIYAPDGTLLEGRILVSTVATWTSADGFLILQGYTITVPVTSGAFSVDLVPNVGSSPASVYSVEFQVTSGYFSQEWSVPAPSSPPASVGLPAVIV